MAKEKGTGKTNRREKVKGIGRRIGKGTKAAFVICKTNKEDVIISARSNGEINVQVILEGMNGGGHLTSAGLQRKNESIESLKKELLDNINKYFGKGETKDESNSSK